MCIYIYIYTYTFVYMCIYIYVCIYIYILFITPIYEHVFFFSASDRRATACREPNFSKYIFYIFRANSLYTTIRQPFTFILKPFKDLLRLSSGILHRPSAPHASLSGLCVCLCVCPSDRPFKKTIQICRDYIALLRGT